MRIASRQLPISTPLVLRSALVAPKEGQSRSRSCNDLVRPSFAEKGLDSLPGEVLGCVGANLLLFMGIPKATELALRDGARTPPR